MTFRGSAMAQTFFIATVKIADVYGFDDIEKVKEVLKSTLEEDADTIVLDIDLQAVSKEEWIKATE